MSLFDGVLARKKALDAERAQQKAAKEAAKEAAQKATKKEADEAYAREQEEREEYQRALLQPGADGCYSADAITYFLDWTGQADLRAAFQAHAVACPKCAAAIAEATNRRAAARAQARRWEAEKKARDEWFAATHEDFTND